MTMAILFVPVGSADHWISGDTLAPSQVNLAGMAWPFLKFELVTVIDAPGASPAMSACPFCNRAHAVPMHGGTKTAMLSAIRIGHFFKAISVHQQTVSASVASVKGIEAREM